MFEVLGNLPYYRPHRNPVTFSLICVILVLYCGLLVLCRRADRHDAKKGGIVYLLDNTPIDQQKYEITIETGFRKGAGTSAKVSKILWVPGLKKKQDIRRE